MRKIREAKAALEAKALAEAEQAEAEQAEAEQAEAEQAGAGRGVSSTQAHPPTRHSGTSPIRTPGSCPGQGDGTSSSPTTARRWWTMSIR